MASADKDADAWLGMFEEDRVELEGFQEIGCCLRYGSSLDLMAKASLLINDEFHSNPNRDSLKNQRKGRSLLFCLVEPIGPDGGLACAARAILEQHASLDGARRIVIDYIHTKLSERGNGHGTRVVAFLKSLASLQSADMFVAATEDSCPYWMSQGFVLEQDPSLVKEYNAFTDTHLLKLPTNRAGSSCSSEQGQAPSARAPVQLEDDESDEAFAKRLQEEEEDAALIDPNNEDASDDEEEEEEGSDGEQDDDLAAAIAMSKKHDRDSSGKDDDLEAAIAMSMQPQCSPAAQTQELGLDEDDDLAQAIALSMEKPKDPQSSENKRPRH